MPAAQDSPWQQPIRGSKPIVLFPEQCDAPQVVSGQVPEIDAAQVASTVVQTEIDRGEVGVQIQDGELEFLRSEVSKLHATIIVGRQALANWKRESEEICNERQQGFRDVIRFVRSGIAVLLAEQNRMMLETACLQEDLKSIVTHFMPPDSYKFINPPQGEKAENVHRLILRHGQEIENLAAMTERLCKELDRVAEFWFQPLTESSSLFVIIGGISAYECSSTTSPTILAASVAEVDKRRQTAIIVGDCHQNPSSSIATAHTDEGVGRKQTVIIAGDCNRFDTTRPRSVFIPKYVPELQLRELVAKYSLCCRSVKTSRPKSWCIVEFDSMRDAETLAKLLLADWQGKVNKEEDDVRILQARRAIETGSDQESVRVPPSSKSAGSLNVLGPCLFAAKKDDDEAPEEAPKRTATSTKPVPGHTQPDEEADENWQDGEEMWWPAEPIQHQHTHWHVECATSPGEQDWPWQSEYAGNNVRAGSRVAIGSKITLGWFMRKLESQVLRARAYALTGQAL